MFWKKCEPWDGVTLKSLNPDSTMTQAPAIWSQVTGIPSHGSRLPQRPTPIRTYGRFALRAASLLNSAHLVRHLAALRPVECVDVHDHDIVDIPDRAVAQDLLALADEVFRSTPSTLSSSISRLSTSGRIWSTANSFGLPGGTFMFTANSISTCVPMPHVPCRASGLGSPARGKILCFRIGANVTTRLPVARDAVVHGVIFRRIGRRRQGTGSGPSPRRRGRTAATKASGDSIAPRVRLSCKVEREKSCWAFRIVSIVEKNCMRWRGYFGQNRTAFPPSTTVFPSPSATGQCHRWPSEEEQGRNCTIWRRRRSRDRTVRDAGSRPCAA